MSDATTVPETTHHVRDAMKARYGAAVKAGAKASCCGSTASDAIGGIDPITELAARSVIISNCVVNLSPDKDQVLREVFRVLEPTRIYSKDDTAKMASSCCGDEVEVALKALDGAVMSAFIRARCP